ncbi:MAG: FAD-dependent oxidoreductase [Thermoplasmata archaeon]
MASVIIGSGAAGMAAAARLRKLGEEVVLVSRERAVYSLCALPYVLSGEVDEERIITHDEAALREMGVTPHLGAEATGIDPARRRVVLAGGTEIDYDTLLLATGSTPSVPAALKIELPGVHTFNSLQDTRELLSAAAVSRSAVVLGAGLTGLECACALRRRGLEVTVVEMEDRVLPRALDRDMSPPVEEALAKGGVGLRLGTRVTGLSRAGGRNAVRIQGPGGKEGTLEADIVVLCLGVRPELSLARSAGLRTNRGVIVGPDMRTSDPHIFAAGDVAEFEGEIPATWPTAVKQGEVAAVNMAGGRASFTHLDNVNAATIFGLPVFSIGKTASQLEGSPVECELWREGGVWRKLVTINGAVAGYQSVGSHDVYGVPSILQRTAGPLMKRFLRFGASHPLLASGALEAAGSNGPRVRKRKS